MKIDKEPFDRNSEDKTQINRNMIRKIAIWENK